MLMLLVGLIIFALFVYVLWWVLSQIPMAPPVRVIITVVFVLIVLVGLLSYMPSIGLPHGRLG